MVLYQAKDYKDMSRKAANIISAQVIMKPNAVLGLATGSTPVGAYEQLVEWYNKGDIDFSQVTSVNLDEYKGLSGDNDQSYRYFMNKNLFDNGNFIMSYGTANCLSRHAGSVFRFSYFTCDFSIRDRLPIGNL